MTFQKSRISAFRRYYKVSFVKSAACLLYFLQSHRDIERSSETLRIRGSFCYSVIYFTTDFLLIPALFIFFRSALRCFLLKLFAFTVTLEAVFLNACFLIAFKLLPFTSTLFSFLQLKNALPSIVVTPLPIVTDFSFLQFANAWLPMLVTVSLITTFWILDLPLYAFLPIPTIDL